MKYMKFVVVLFFTFMLLQNGFAEELISEEFEYTILNDGTVEITDYTGEDSVLSIPSEINGKVVTSIGDSVFICCSSLVSIVIPNTITSIGDSAFGSCSSLDDITIPDSIAYIGNEAFNGCKSLREITIPDSVTFIGSGAFSNCSSLINITIPKSVVEMGGNPFYRTTANIIIDADNTSFAIVDGVLFDTVKKELVSYPYEKNTISYSIPTGTLHIANFAFCSASLQEIIIPDSVISIGNSAFASCSSLREITIPDSVTYIGSATFISCESLTDITISNSVTSLGESVFNGCKSLTDITIPNSITTIGDRAFNGCCSLMSITVPNSVTSIGNGAFSGCDMLKVMVADGSYAMEYAIEYKLDYITDSSANESTNEHTNEPTYEPTAEPTKESTYDFKTFRWGDSEDTIISKEGQPDGRGDMNGIDAYYIYYETTAVGMDVILGYYFCDEGLYAVRYFPNEKHSNESKYIDDYSAFRSAMTSKYGEPIIDNESWDNDTPKSYYAQAKGDALSYGYLSYYTLWMTDTTLITMTMDADNYEISTFIDYSSFSISPGTVDYSDDL